MSGGQPFPGYDDAGGADQVRDGRDGATDRAARAGEDPPHLLVACACQAHRLGDGEVGAAGAVAGLRHDGVGAGDRLDAAATAAVAVWAGGVDGEVADLAGHPV